MTSRHISRAARRLVLTLLLLVLTSASAAVIIVVSHRQSSEMVRGLATTLMREVATRARAETLGYLEIGPRGLETIRQLGRGDAVLGGAESSVGAHGRAPAYGRAPALERRMRSLLVANDEIAMLNFGDPAGDFLMVKRMPGGTFSSKRVRRRDGVAASTWDHDEPTWSRQATYADRREPAAEAFDPRSRPWFRQAVEDGALTWIEPYVFYSDAMPGISCALPLHDPMGQLVGVVSADIAIADLSRRLAAFDLGGSGRVVILTADGRIIAHPHLTPEALAEEARRIDPATGPRLVLRRVDEISDPVLATAFDRRPPGGLGVEPQAFSFDHQGDDWVARFEHFTLGPRRQWIVGVVAPQAELLGSLDGGGHTFTVAILLVCLFLTVGLAVALLLRAARLEIELVDLRTVRMQRLIDDLEAKTAAMERFTYTASHDLKSPLITIRGFLGLLEKDLEAGDEGRVRQDLKRIHEATGRMARLLNELLHVSRTNRLVDPLEEVPLGELAGEVAAELDEKITERGVELTVAPDLPAVRGDRARLLEVMTNLIDNAVLFTGDQARPEVEVGWRPGEEVAGTPPPVFYVRDNGQGIDPRYQVKIFDLFEQLDQSVDGTGTGLALVKRIVELHGGRIWVESAGQGQGATFCFTVPGPRDPRSRRDPTTGWRFLTELFLGRKGSAVE